MIISSIASVGTARQLGTATDEFCSCGCARNVHHFDQEAVNTARNGQLLEFIKMNQMFPAAAAPASCSSGYASSSESAVPPRPSPTRRRGEHGSVHKEGETRNPHPLVPLRDGTKGETYGNGIS